MSDVVWSTTASGIIGYSGSPPVPVYGPVADPLPGEHSVIGVSSGLASTEAARLQAQADAAGYRHLGKRHVYTAV